MQAVNNTCSVLQGVAVSMYSTSPHVDRYKSYCTSYTCTVHTHPPTLSKGQLSHKTPITLGGKLGISMTALVTFSVQEYTEGLWAYMHIPCTHITCTHTHMQIPTRYTFMYIYIVQCVYINACIQLYVATAHLIRHRLCTYSPGYTRNHHSSHL